MRIRLPLLAVALLCLSAFAPTQTISVYGPLSGQNIWTGTNSYPNGVKLGPVTVSQLSSLIGLSTVVVVSDATPGTNPCSGSGTGALAAYVNGQWNCSANGGGGSIPNPFIVNSNIPSSTPSSPGASTTSFGITTDGNLSVAANGQAQYDTVPTEAVLGWTNDFNWSLAPTSPATLTAATPATITLSHCPRGLDPSILVINSDTLGSDYFVDIGGTGTAEYVGVTATSCTFTSNGASGTITVTPANSHTAGYTIGSASVGAQEAINASDAGAGRLAYIRVPCGIWNWDAPVMLFKNNLLLDGGGCSRIQQTHSQSGVILGDHNPGDAFNVSVVNFGMIADYQGTARQVNMISGVSYTGAPGPCTFTISFTANHDFNLYDWIYIGGSLNSNYVQGIWQVSAIPAANEINFTKASCPSPSGSVYSGGYAVANYTHFENELSLQGTLRDVKLYSCNVTANNCPNYNIENQVDENMIIDAFTNNNTDNSIRPCVTTGSGVTQSNPEFCGAVILEPIGAGIITLSNSSIYCFPGNCIDNWGGNDLRIETSVLENWNQFAVRTTTRRGGAGRTDITNSHLEPSTCRFSTTLGCSVIISTGQPVTITGGSVTGGATGSSNGTVPEYGTNGVANTYWYYYVIPVSNSSDAMCTTQPNDQRCLSNLGTGPLLPSGYALADSSSGGTFSAAWPAVRGATSYTLLRTTQASGSSSSVPPVVNPYGTGNFLIASGINPLTYCTDVQCTYTDSVGLTPSSYTVAAFTPASYCPFIDYWPTSLFLGCNSDAAESTTTSYYTGPSMDLVTENLPQSDGIVFLTPVFPVNQGENAGEQSLQAFHFISSGQTLNNTVTTPGIALWKPAKSGLTGDTVANIKGVVNNEYQTSLTSKTYPFDIYTLEDCNWTKSLNTFGMRPSNDTCDVAIGLDQQGGLSERAAASLSWYVNTLNNNSGWLARLTSSLFTFKVPVTINGNLIVTGSCTGCGGGGGNPTLDNCTPDQTGNSFYSVLSLSEYFYAGWQFVPGNASYINCTVYVPTAQSGATIILDIAANDATAGHTANFQTCDGVINSGTINLGTALTCASAQTFTTTSTAYNRVTLTFNVQSTLSNGSMLIVKIATATTGTQPTANILVYPHFVL